MNERQDAAKNLFYAALDVLEEEKNQNKPHRTPYSNVGIATVVGGNYIRTARRASTLLDPEQIRIVLENAIIEHDGLELKHI